MKELKKCPVCSSKKINFLVNGHDKLLGNAGEFSLSECKNCEAIFLNPQPVPSELERYYSNEKYYSLKKIDTTSKKLKIKTLLYKTYFNKENKNLFLRLLLSPLKFIVRGTIIKKGSKLLDVGSGSGQFLYEMKELGLDVYGIEPGEFDEGGNKRYHLNIKNENLEGAKYKKEFFDVITINHVLEHVNNPYETISEIKRILKREGVLIIGIPNTNSIAKRIFSKNWLALDVPRHIINYSDKNINILLSKSGFKILRIRYNSRPNQFAFSMMYSLNIKNKLIERLFEIVSMPLTWFVNFLRMGDQIEVWCERG